MNHSDMNLKRYWFVALLSCSLIQVSPVVANSGKQGDSYYSTEWQTSYLCIPDDKYSMGIAESGVGRSDFSSTFKFLVNFEDQKFKFKEFDQNDWKELKTITYRSQYSYLDTFTHFSFFPFTLSMRGSDAPTFKYDRMLFGAYVTDQPDLYMGISLVGSCSAIN